LSTTYLLLITLPEILMVNLNHKPSKNVDVEMIGLCEIQIGLNPLVKYEVFGPVVHTLEGVMPIKYKWVFVRKLNEIMKYKV
jgi:hypothetical protein